MLSSALVSAPASATPPANATTPTTSATPPARGFKQTGIVATVGIDVGIPGLHAGADQGVVIGAADPVTGKRKVAAFSQVRGGAALMSASKVLSRHPELRGTEYSVGPVGRKSPVYGDRVQIPVIPDVISVDASRKGGLGVTFYGVPLPVPGIPPGLVRAGASLYVTDPRLAKISNPLLDRVDKAVAKVHRATKPIIDRVKNVKPSEP